MEIAVEERSALTVSGWIGVIVVLVLAALEWHLWRHAVLSVASGAVPGPLSLAPPLLLGAILLLALKGFVILQPNTAAVLTFFGKYAGSVREDGFHYYNPLCRLQKLSLRIQNLATPTLKVNDANGNPIEIGAVIAWQVSDTFRAMFEVEAYSEYIRVQSESALRQVAGSHPYDGPNRNATLRGNVQGTAKELIETIEQHVEPAGLRVLDARLAHLAYAPEIAMAMLRQQQAQQVVAARQTIVAGAVGMVEIALSQLESRKLVQLSNDQRAQLVTNLMTVLVGENEAQPVLQMSTGPAASAA